MMEKITLEELMADIRAVEHKLRLLRGKDIVTINLPMSKSTNLATFDETFADTITHITSMRCRVRTISNSFKSIHRLPLETLSEIFALVPTRRSSYPIQSYGHIYGSGIGPVSHLVPLTEVCHLWRDILHQDPRFWSEVEDRGGAQLGAPTFTHYIHRNTTGPLYVKLLSASPSKETRLLLEHSGSRIRELHIYNGGQGQSDSIPSLSSIFAHQLRSCKIDFLIDGSKRTTSLFKGYAPRLRFLWINFCVAIPSNAFPSLTNLLIEWPGPGLTVHHFPFAELIAFLQGCPSLREVHLVSCDIPSQVSPLLPDVRSRDLVMPRLRKLSIIGWRGYRDASLHLAICSRLSLPADCLLYMAHIPPTRLREVLDVLVASARRERPFTRLIVTQHTGNTKPAQDCITLQMVDSRNSMGIRVDVKMEEGFDRYPSRRIRLPSERRTSCAALSNYPLLSDIQLLHLSGDDVHLLGGAWSTLLHSTFSSLTSLVIVEPYDQDSLHLVLECSNGADAAPRMPCPQLQTLTIRMSLGRDLTFLPSLLASRAHAGYPLHQLSLVLMGAVFEGSIVEDVDVLNRLAEFVDVFDVHLGNRHVGVKGPLGPEPSPWSSLLPRECTTRSGETPAVFWPKWS